MNTDPKPGRRTTEFYLSAAATILGAVLASGIIPESQPIGHAAGQIGGAVMAVLGSLGYTYQRTQLKKATAAAFLEDARRSSRGMEAEAASRS